jgi:transcriptional regulator with XRE-family HTH domain
MRYTQLGAVLMVIIDITPHQALKQLESDLGLTPEDLAHALGVSRRTLERWRSGEAYPQRESREKLAELMAFHEHVCDVFTSLDAVRKWMHTEARYLAWITPADALRLGRVDHANSALGVLEHGIFI